MRRSNIRGREAFRARIRKLPRAYQRAAAKALEQNANEMAAAAQADAPEDTGDLKISVIAASVRGSAGLIWRVAAGVGRARLGGKTLPAGDQEKGFYATFIEHGTSKNPGKPFFFYNYRRFRQRFKSRVSRALTKAGKKHFNG